jgi:hypothetical protein
MSSQAALVRTLRDILSAFPTALSRLPADVNVHQAQRSVTVLQTSLERLEESLKGRRT